MLDAGILEQLKVLITKDGGTIKKEVCWIISNITAGTKAQVQLVLDSGLFETMASMCVDNNVDLAVRTEAIWAVANATASLTEPQHHTLLIENMLPKFLTLLKGTYPKPKILAVVLEAIERILETQFGEVRSDL